MSINLDNIDILIIGSGRISNHLKLQFSSYNLHTQVISGRSMIVNPLKYKQENIESIKIVIFAAYIKNSPFLNYKLLRQLLRFLKKSHYKGKFFFLGTHNSIPNKIYKRVNINMWLNFQNRYTFVKRLQGLLIKFSSLKKPIIFYLPLVTDIGGPHDAFISFLKQNKKSIGISPSSRFFLLSAKHLGKLIIDFKSYEPLNFETHIFPYSKYAAISDYHEYDNQEFNSINNKKILSCIKLFAQSLKELLLFIFSFIAFSISYSTLNSHRNSQLNHDASIPESLSFAKKIQFSESALPSSMIRNVFPIHISEE
jgi:hypothetical protein